MSVLLAQLRGYNRLGGSGSELPTTAEKQQHQQQQQQSSIRLGAHKRLVRVVVGLGVLCFLAYTCPSIDKETRRLGGSPGFYYLENVWYNNRTFHAYSSLPDALPKKDETLSALGFVVTEHAREQAPDVCFAGTTLFLNEGAGDAWSGMYHYYHFAAENILGGLAAMATWAGARDLVLGKGMGKGKHGAARDRYVPDQIIVPWDNRWHDVYGMNDMVVEGIWNDQHIGPDQWAVLEEDMEGSDGWIYFERIVIVDRWAAHRHSPQVEKWYKMAAGIFEEHHQPHFFSGARNRLLHHYNIHARKPSDPQQIVYIDRQNSDRKLPDATHAELLHQLETFAETEHVDFRYLKLEDMSPRDQIEAVAHASIMLGVHGNGLTHELWLPEDSTVIELWPPHSFQRDYECVATVLGHEYVAIRNDSIYTKHQQMSHTKGPDELHSGTPILLDVPFFMSVLKGLVHA